jgi:hypothetical protein
MIRFVIFALHILWDLCVLSDNIAIRNHPRLQNGSADHQSLQQDLKT